MRVRRFQIAAALALVASAPALASAATRLQTRLTGLPVAIRYESGSERAVSIVSRTVELAVPEMARAYGLDSLPPMVLQLERNSADFHRAALGRAPDWGAAIAFRSSHTAIFDLTACAQHPRGLEAVVRHELSHLLFGEATGNMSTPLWFEEGLAMRQASEWGIGDSWTLLEGRVRGSLPALADLDSGFPAWGRDAEVAYTLSMRAVNGIMRSAPPRALADLAERCRTADTFEQAFEQVFGYSLEDYSTRFSNELRRTFRWTTVVSSIPVLFGFMSVLFLLAYGAKRIRAIRTMRRWAAEDRANPAPVVPFPLHRVPGVRSAALEGETSPEDPPPPEPLEAPPPEPLETPTPEPLEAPPPEPLEPPAREGAPPEGPAPDDPPPGATIH